MILDKFSLKGKVAIVTGATGGLGRGITLALSEAGADLVLVSRTLSSLKIVAKEIENLDRQALIISANVTKKEEVNLVIEKTLEKFGKIDILVNGAGITHRSIIEDFPEELWDKVIDTNLKGAFLFSQAAGKVMIKQNKGKIINIVSLLSVIGGEFCPAYAASKGGLSQLTKALAVAWAQYNINVNAIGPGYFKTSMTKAIYEDEVRNNKILSRIPMRRWGKAEEDLSGAVIYLASEASNYVNGQTIYVDGGWLAY
jgi:2-deoxy-D-gluconate 3-dehydrogenase